MRYVTAALTLYALQLSFAFGQDSKTTPTYNKDVAPILARNCVVCHRTGEIAPMPLVTYEEVRPWAKSIREAVLTRAMPPWHADPRYGKFSNEKRLADAEIRAIVDWVDNRAPRGHPNDTPPVATFVEGWQIGKPDVVLFMKEEFTVPAEGPDLNLEFEIPTGFTEDKWVVAAEVRGNPRAVHHNIASVYDADGRRDPTGRLASAVPGKMYDRFAPGSGKLVRAGSKIVFSIHYHPSGKIEKDRSSIGLIFARSPLEWQVYSRPVADPSLIIPPKDPNYRSTGEWIFPVDAELTLMKPHMHYRGKDMLYQALYPDGREEILLFVPKYDMNWQMNYELAEPKYMPKGTKLIVIAHFDNSEKNPWNPDPNVQVRWGSDSRDEMMEGWFDYRVRLEKAVAQTNLKER